MNPVHVVIRLLPLAAMLAAPVLAQSPEAESEELILLSPFLVASAGDDTYLAQNTLAGTRVATPLIDPATANIAPTVPVSIFKPADAIAVQFVLSHAGDRQEVRNRELYASVEALRLGIEKIPGLRMEQREVRFTGGNRKLFSSTRGNSTYSFASILVFAELKPGLHIADRVKQVRDVLEATKLEGQTKAGDGSVGLYIKNPEGYRREILQKIFEDLAFVREGVGAEFEVRPFGMNQRVRTRIASETEIELWIEYTFGFYSIREIEATKAAK